MNMIEKVARAIEKAIIENPYKMIPVDGFKANEFGINTKAFAEVAIQTMREPSEEMIAAAQSLIKDTPGVAGEDICPDPEFAYETMIDAALKE